MRKKIFALFSLSVIGVLLLLALLLLPAPAGVEAQAPLEVIATGLNNPRHLTFGPDGALYIAEAGYGGDGSDGRCLDGPEGTVCYGPTGSVTKWMTDGTQTRVVTDMVSLASPTDGSGAGGPHAVAFDDSGEMYVIVGLGADPAIREPGGPLTDVGEHFGQIAHVMMSGTWTDVVDIAGYEAANNPNDDNVDSNPYDIMWHSGGSFLVADAGGNDLLHVGTAPTYTISTLSTFTTRTVEFPPGSGNMVPMQAVPTSVDVGAGGDYYVGQLTGFPFPIGGANVYSVPAGGGDPTEHETGFTNITDIAFGDDGSLYVLEMDNDGLITPDTGTGELTRVYPNGARETLAANGLVAPTGMTVGPDGMIYISNFGPLPAGAGQVVRLDPNGPTDVGVRGGLQGTASGTPLALAIIAFLIPVAALALWRRQRTA